MQATSVAEILQLYHRIYTMYIVNVYMQCIYTMYMQCIYNMQYTMHNTA